MLSIAVPRLRSVFDGCMAVGAGLAIAWIVDRRTPVHADEPPVRPLRALASIVVIATVAIAGSASALVWRRQTRRDAQTSVAAALTRDGSAVDALASQFAGSTRRRVPPRLRQPDVDRLHDLVRTLGERAPEASPALRKRIAAALPLVRVAAHEADVLGLLSAAEYLGASSAGRAPELAPVVARYEHEARPADPTLEAWADLARGQAFRRSAAPLAALASAVGETHS